MQSHLRIFTEFCHHLGLRPFPVQAQTILCYIAFLSVTGRSYGTIQNHISSIKHFHRFFGFPSWWDNLYSFQLVLRGFKCFLGAAPARKLPITPLLILHMVSLFDISKPLQAAIRALFLVAFFSFLRKSNLVVQSDCTISPKVPGALTFLCHITGLFSIFAHQRPSSFSNGPYAFHVPLFRVVPFVPFRPLHTTFVLMCLAHQTHFFS